MHRLIESSSQETPSNQVWILSERRAYQWLLENINAIAIATITLEKGSRAPDEDALLKGFPLVNASGLVADVVCAVFCETAAVEVVIVAAV